MKMKHNRSEDSGIVGEIGTRVFDPLESTELVGSGIDRNSHEIN